MALSEYTMSEKSRKIAQLSQGEPKPDNLVKSLADMWSDRQKEMIYLGISQLVAGFLFCASSICFVVGCYFGARALLVVS
jgi:hypothetical protein